jgi:hypothetical protein
MSRSSKAVVEHKNILVKVLASVLVLMLADVALTALFGSQIRSSSPFAFGSNDFATFISIAFLEGGVIFTLGAFFASGIAESRTTVRSNPADIDRIEKSTSPPPQRKKTQISIGIFLMLIGGLLLAISFIIVMTTS